MSESCRWIIIEYCYLSAAGSSIRPLGEPRHPVKKETHNVLVMLQPSLLPANNEANIIFGARSTSANSPQISGPCKVVSIFPSPIRIQILFQYNVYI